MGKSARILGGQLNLTAEEMNELFKLNGLLKGKPGEYEVTEAGEPYATERDEHRGPGGYSWYNRDWTVRTWEDSVLDAMDTSPEKIWEARENVSERRRARHMIAVEEQPEDETPYDEDEEFEDSESSAYVNLVDIVNVKGIAIVVVIVGTIIAMPHIKKFCTEKIKPTYKKAWCKVTKKPYKLSESTEAADESSEGELDKQKDDAEKGVRSNRV